MQIRLYPKIEKALLEAVESANKRKPTKREEALGLKSEVAPTGLVNGILYAALHLQGESK